MRTSIPWESLGLMIALHAHIKAEVYEGILLHQVHLGVLTLLSPDVPMVQMTLAPTNFIVKQLNSRVASWTLGAFHGSLNQYLNIQ